MAQFKSLHFSSPSAWWLVDHHCSGTKLESNPECWTGRWFPCRALSGLHRTSWGVRCPLHDFVWLVCWVDSHHWLCHLPGWVDSVIVFLWMVETHTHLTSLPIGSFEGFWKDSVKMNCFRGDVWGLLKFYLLAILGPFVYILIKGAVQCFLFFFFF